MKKRNKYGAQRTEVDGIVFDSKREAKRWQELKLLERGGEITHLERQVPVLLMGQGGPIRTPKGRQAKYIADFRYWDPKEKFWVWEDAKGKPTDVYLLKKAICEAMGLEIREV